MLVVILSICSKEELQLDDTELVTPEPKSPGAFIRLDVCDHHW
jgi:hypothetical protein